MNLPVSVTAEFTGGGGQKTKTYKETRTIQTIHYKHNDILKKIYIYPDGNEFINQCTYLNKKWKNYDMFQSTRFSDIQTFHNFKKK